MSMRVIFKPQMSTEAVNEVMSEELERFYADDTAEELDQDNITAIKEAQEAKKIVNVALRDYSISRFIIPLGDTEDDLYRAYNSLTDLSFDGIYEGDDGEAYIKHGFPFRAMRIAKIRTLTSQGRVLFDQWRRSDLHPFSDSVVKTYEDFRNAVVDEKYSQSFSLSSLVGDRLESIEKYATI